MLNPGAAVDALLLKVTASPGQIIIGPALPYMAAAIGRMHGW